MEVYQGKLDYIALCFAKEDRSTAEALIAKLLEKRLRVWSSERGCNVKKKDDAARFGECRTALLLISKDWLESESCAMQLRAAAEQEKALVLLFMGGANFVGKADLNALISRSARMIDYDPADDAACGRGCCSRCPCRPCAGSAPGCPLPCRPWSGRPCASGRSSPSRGRSR